MNVTVLSEDEDGNEVYERFQAYEDNYAVGVTGVTDVYYDIKEGYPIDNEKYVDLVNNKSWSVNYDSYFAQNVGYEIKPGRGLDVFTIGEGGNGSGEGMICCCSTGSTFITKPISGNSKYVYIKQGSSEPTYYILCKYIKSGDEEEDEGDTLEGGGFTFLRIRYFNRRRFYQEYYKPNGEFVQNGKHKKAKSIRNNIAALLNRNTGWTTYMATVDATRINCNQKSWEEQILSGSTFYETNKNNIFSGSGNTLVIKPQYIVYYVDKIKENNNVLYKIYPSFNELNKKDDGINLNLYRVEGPFSADSSTDITLTCELDKKDFSASTITSDDIVLFNKSINFETNNGGYGVLDVISRNKSGKTSAITNFSENIVSTDFYNFSLLSSTVDIMSGDTDNEGTEYYAVVTLNFNLTIKKGEEGDAIDKKIDQIYFYLTNKKNGERLDVVRRSASGGKEIIFSKTPDGSEPITGLTFDSIPSSEDIYILYELRNGVITPSSLTTSSNDSFPFSVGIDVKYDKHTTIRKKEITGDYVSYYSTPCVISAYSSITSYEKTITVSGQGLKSGKLIIKGNVNEASKIVFLKDNEKETIDSKELFMIPNSGNSTQYIIVYNNTGEECEPKWEFPVGLNLEKDNEKVSKTNITYYKVAQTDMGHDPYPKYERMEYYSSNTITIQNNNEIGSSLSVVIKPYCMFRIKNAITNKYINDFKILIVFDPYSEYKDYYKETYLRTESQPTYYNKYHVLFENGGEQEATIVPPIPYNSSGIPFEISIISGTIPDENVKGFGCIMLGTQPIMSNTYNNGSGITSSYFDVKKYNIGIGDSQGELRTLRLANLYDNFIINASVSFVNNYNPENVPSDYKNIFDGYMTMRQKEYGEYDPEIFKCVNGRASSINYKNSDGSEDLCQLNIVIYKVNGGIDVTSTNYSYNVNIEGANGGYDSFPIYNKTNNRISTHVDENDNPIISINDIRISSLFTIGENINKEGNINITVTLIGQDNGNN